MSRTDDGAFNGGDGDVQKVVPIRPWDAGRVFVMVVTKQKA